MRKTCVILAYVILTLSTMLVYWQVRNFDFVNYDDSLYVYENPDISNGLSWHTLARAFSAPHAGNWLPLTWLSFIVDCQLFGLNPGWMHLENALLHLANTLLLFVILRKMTDSPWPSAFVAAAFALHPMHVESVAWIIERKDVLSTFFLLLTLAAYINYVRRGGWFLYMLTVLLFGAGLLAKPMLVTLPLLLLLLDYWPLGRFESQSRRRHLYRMVVEKIPLFALSGVFCITTFLAQRSSGSVPDVGLLSLQSRTTNALLSCAKYIGRMFWPRNLAVFYPFDAGDIQFWQVATSALLMVVVTVLAIRFGRKRKYLLVGWLWFVMALLPVIGLVQSGSQAMADRYTYIPYIGLFIMIAWGLPELLSNWPHRKAALGASMALVLTSLGICAHRQASYWNDSITLFSHAIEIAPDNYLAYNNRGSAYSSLGRWREAMQSYEKATSIKPDYAEALTNLGFTYGKLGRWQEAIDAHKRAIKAKPDLVVAYNNLCAAYESLGRYQDAIDAYKQVIRIRPGYAEVHNSLGVAYGKLGRWQEAIDGFSQAVNIRPDYVEAYINRGIAYGSLGRWQEAIADYSLAIKMAPSRAEAYNNRAAACGSLGRWQEAMEDIDHAIRLKPDYAEAYNNRGLAYSSLGRRQDALDAYKQALTIEPNLAEAHYDLGRELLRMGRYDEACGEYHQAIRLKADWPPFMNSLAWLIATNPQIKDRDTNEAIRLAARACELTSYQDAALLDTLAVAYASASRFSEAIDTTEKAMKLADAAGQPQVRDIIASHLALYKQGKPYLESAPAPLPEPNKP